MSIFQESSEFKNLCFYVFNHENAEYIIKDSSGETIIALFETAYEDDNGFDENNPQYEYFTNLVFKNKHTDTLFEFNYHGLPTLEIYHNGKKIV